MFRTFLVTGQIWKIVSHIIGFDFWKMVKTIFEEVFVHDSFKSLYINWLLYSIYEWCQKETLVKFLFSVMQLKLRSRTWCNGQHFSIVNVFLQYAFLKDKKMKNTIAESSFIFLKLLEKKYSYKSFYAHKVKLFAVWIIPKQMIKFISTDNKTYRKYLFPSGTK